MFWSNEKTRHICGLYCKYTEKICLKFFFLTWYHPFRKIKPRFACHVKTKQRVLSKPGILASVCPTEICWAEAQTKHHHPDYKDWANSQSGVSISQVWACPFTSAAALLLHPLVRSSLWQGFGLCADWPFGRQAGSFTTHFPSRSWDEVTLWCCLGCFLKDGPAQGQKVSECVLSTDTAPLLKSAWTWSVAGGEDLATIILVSVGAVSRPVSISGCTKGQLEERGGGFPPHSSLLTP